MSVTLMIAMTGTIPVKLLSQLGVAMEYMKTLYAERCTGEFVCNQPVKKVLPLDEQSATNLVRECDIAGFKRALTKVSEQTWTKLLENGKLDEFPEIRMVRERAMRPVGQYMWITINPEFEHKDLDQVRQLLVKKTLKYCRRKNVKNALWCFEQKGTDDATMGSHPHCHILIEFKEIPKVSDFWRELKNTFKDLCKDYDSFMHGRVCDPKHIERRISYLGKRGREDEPDVQVNKKWRSQNKLKDLFSTGEVAEKWAEKRCLVENVQSDDESEA